MFVCVQRIFVADGALWNVVCAYAFNLSRDAAFLRGTALPVPTVDARVIFLKNWATVLYNSAGNKYNGSCSQLGLNNIPLLCSIQFFLAFFSRPGMQHGVASHRLCCACRRESRDCSSFHRWKILIVTPLASTVGKYSRFKAGHSG
uniref:Putative secreted protein n=1 Tax=Ixodes ricinus TaxID=34613 RepID=A0A6B0UUB1_IXORI